MASPSSSPLKSTETSSNVSPAHQYYLPQELLYKIIHNLEDDRESLINFSSVSRSCEPEARRLFYRRIAFAWIDTSRLDYKSYTDGSDEEDQFDWVSRPPKFPSFLATITSNRPTAACVQELSCTPDSSRDVWTLFHSALQQLINLKCLRVSVVDGAQVSLQDFFADLPFQLSHLCWFDWRYSRGDDDSDIYISFISSQHYLKYLHFASPKRYREVFEPSTRPLESSALETYIGDLPMALHIVPHLKGVTTLGYCEISRKVIEEDKDLIISVFSRLRVLIFYPLFFNDLSLAAQVRHLGSLETLHIVIGEHVVDHGRAVDATTTLPYIPAIFSLRKFIWTANPNSQLGNRNVLFTRELQKNHTEAWFNALPNFEAAYFSIGPQRNRYLRWLRGMTEPEEVSCDDFRYSTPFHDITLDRRLALASERDSVSPLLRRFGY